MADGVLGLWESPVLPSEEALMAGRTLTARGFPLLREPRVTGEVMCVQSFCQPGRKGYGHCGLEVRTIWHKEIRPKEPKNLHFGHTP